MVLLQFSRISYKTAQRESCDVISHDLTMKDWHAYGRLLDAKTIVEKEKNEQMREKRKHIKLYKVIMYKRVIKLFLKSSVNVKCIGDE